MSETNFNSEALAVILSDKSIGTGNITDLSYEVLVHCDRYELLIKGQGTPETSKSSIATAEKIRCNTKRRRQASTVAIVFLLNMVVGPLELFHLSSLSLYQKRKNLRDDIEL